MDEFEHVDLFLFDGLVRLKVYREDTIILCNSVEIGSSSMKMHRTYFYLYGSIINQDYYDLAGENLKDM